MEGKQNTHKNSGLSLFSDSQMETQAVLWQITLISIFWDWSAEEDAALLTLPKSTCFEYRKGHHLLPCNILDWQSHLGNRQSKWLMFTMVIWALITKDNLFLGNYFFLRLELCNNWYSPRKERTQQTASTHRNVIISSKAWINENH